MAVASMAIFAGEVRAARTKKSIEKAILLSCRLGCSTWADLEWSIDEGSRREGVAYLGRSQPCVHSSSSACMMVLGLGL